MEKIIKTISVSDGELFVTSAGQRLPLARFDGRVEIIEKTNIVRVLGTTQKGTKTIHASFIVCGNIEYQQEVPDGYIHAGKVYDAVADTAGRRLQFAGLRFTDSDPFENELTFEITDLELIQALLKEETYGEK